MLAQTPPPPPAAQKRDLKVEKIEAPGAPATGATGVTEAVPRSYAVVVGISHYLNLEAKQQLDFPDADAQSIYTILISPEGGNFKAENVHVLIGPKATLAAVRHEIGEWLPSVAKDDDRVLIYFAGHGFLYEGKGYLAPYDFDPTKIAASGYPMDELGQMIGGKIHAKSKILLTDSCHSGAISPEDTEALNKTLSGLQPSLFSLTASRDRERSFESTAFGGGHGVFTYYVVKGMQGEADTSHDGIVTADELAEYVHTEVRAATKGEQNPTSDRGSFDAEMRLSYVPATAAPAIAPAPKTGSLIIESNMDGVEVFVDGNTAGVVDKGKHVSVPGLTPGQHTVKGVKMGYEPDGPREETVYPGEPSTVSIKIMIARRRSKQVLDDLDKGIVYYNKGYEQNYKKAVELFEKAFSADPTYSQAAFYLGLTYNALFEQDKAQQYFQKAIAIDPDFLEARADYAGMLLDTGSTDESIRQINAVLTRQPNHAVALTMLAQADRLKGIYPASIEMARMAIQLKPASAEPHLWLGDSLRLSGKWADAGAEYDRYLKLSDFDSHLAGQLNYYVLGSLIGFGRRKHPSQADIWKDLRSLAWFGICDCQNRMSNFDAAIASCQKSLTYDAGDPYAQYALGLAYMKRAKQTGSVADLTTARPHFEQVLTINQDLEEAKFARQNLAAIGQALVAMGLASSR